MPKIKEQPPTLTEDMSVQDAIDLLNKSGYQVQSNGKQEEEEYSLVEPTLQITHEQLSKGRFYHEVGDENPDNWIPSVTTQLDIIKLGPGLDTYNRNLGHLAPKDRDAKAQQGTDVHYQAVPLVRGETVTIDDLRTFIISNPDESWKYLYKTVDQYTYHIRKYLASLCRFWYEHKPRAVACEYPILHPDLPFAGRLDLVVEMKKAKNSKKTSRILIDLKTGGKWLTHAWQNSAYKVGWELLNPDLPIDYIAGLYLSDGYRDEPNYQLHYQKFNYNAFKHVSELWYEVNSNAKGEMKPTIKKAPPTKFNLYNEKETK